MELYINTISDDIDEVAEPIKATLEAWIEAQEREYQVDYQCDDDLPLEDWIVGMRFAAKNQRHLKAPLKFLEGVAKEFKVDFVVGIYDNATGQREDVCYFGHEEGRADMFEMSNYLGL